MDSQVKNGEKIWGDRINRSTFFLRSVLGFILLGVLWFLSILMVSNDIPFLPLFILFAGPHIMLAFIAIGRFHDLGQSGGWGLLFLVPIIGLATFVYLCISVGMDGENDYGSDPSLLDPNERF